MIQRNYSKCHNCNQKFLLRAVIPLATTEYFRFVCPNCEIELRSKIILDYDILTMTLEPEGFEIEKPEVPESLPMVTISTDLPVHKTKHVNNLSEGGSPFLWLAQKMTNDFHIWKKKVDSMEKMRKNSLSNLNSLITYTKISNWERINEQLLKMEIDTKQSTNANIIYINYRLLNSFYSPIIETDSMVPFLDDYYIHLNKCINSHKPEYLSLLKEWNSLDLFKSFRFKVLNTYSRVFEHFDAFLVGLLYHSMPSSLKQEINDYRIFRDDYNTVKGLYQDLFELNSQLTIFLGSILNLAIRNNPWNYSTGHTTFNSFKKAKSFERLKILSELPKLSEILGSVSRQKRNMVGHFNADFETKTGNLRYDNGSEENYIVFLGDFYNSVKALWFMLILIEKFDLDYNRFIVEI